MNVKALRIATRGSALAFAQTKLVADALKEHSPDLEIQIKTITTSGDQDRISPLWKMSGSGFFTTQVEQALIDGTADIAVHSYKDLPTQITEGLIIAAIGKRDYPQDAVISNEKIRSISEFPEGTVIGTSSPRRIAQIRHKRPDLAVKPIRGNVETRLRKVRQGEYNAVILARAGLERLDLSKEITFTLDPADFIPAPAQGALAVQCRNDNQELISLLQCLHHEPTAITVSAERRVLSALHPGCHAPAGVFASLANHAIMIRAFVAGLDGKRFIMEVIDGPVSQANALADTLTDQLFKAGADDILKDFENA